MTELIFSEQEKVEFFNKIALRFYERNFGQCAKVDFELLMFHFYYSKLINEHMKDDGTIDYLACSDYVISKELGITQQRVRNLKIKEALIYPKEIDWKKSFSLQVDKARYDKATGKIIVNILDPNLYIEIQNFIEEQDAYIEKQLNSKILVLRVEYFIDLIVSLEDDSNRKRIKREVKKAFKKMGKEESMFDEKNIGKSLIEIGANVTGILVNLTSLISPTNFIGQAFIRLVQI